MVNPKGRIIVIVEPHRESLEAIRNALRKENFIPLCTTDVKVGEEYCSEYLPSLVYIGCSLDINNSLDFCKRLKQYKPGCKIILGSNIPDENSTEIVTKGFQYGIDDYIRKPFSQQELIARIKKLLSMIDCSDYIQYHSLRLYINRQELLFNDIRIYLSKNETKILDQLINNKGKPSSLSILSKILSHNNAITNDTAIRMCVARLKKKLEENTGMKIIKCRYGVGYYIAI